MSCCADHPVVSAVILQILVDCHSSLSRRSPTLLILYHRRRPPVILTPTSLVILANHERAVY